jgi:hypothetical protein
LRRKFSSISTQANPFIDLSAIELPSIQNSPYKTLIQHYYTPNARPSLVLFSRNSVVQSISPPQKRWNIKLIRLSMVRRRYRATAQSLPPIAHRNLFHDATNVLVLATHC